MDEVEFVNIYAQIKINDLDNPEATRRVTKVKNKILSGDSGVNCLTAYSILDVCAINDDIASKYIAGEYDRVFILDKEATEALKARIKNSLTMTTEATNNEALDPSTVEPSDSSIIIGGGLKLSLLDWSILDYNTSIKGDNLSFNQKLVTKENGSSKLQIFAEYKNPETNSKVKIAGELDPTNPDPRRAVTLQTEFNQKLNKQTTQALQRSLPTAMIPIITSTVAATGYYIADRVDTVPDEVAASINQAITTQNQMQTLPSPPSTPELHTDGLIRSENQNPVVGTENSKCNCNIM